MLGDSIQLAPRMPKSGHMANSHAKVAAAAIVAELSGWPINPPPMLTNTCYSFVDAKNVIHVASVHEYVAAEKTFKTVAGSGGVSRRAERAGRCVCVELGAHDLGRQPRPDVPSMIDERPSEPREGDEPPSPAPDRAPWRMPLDMRSTALVVLAVLAVRVRAALGERGVHPADVRPDVQLRAGAGGRPAGALAHPARAGGRRCCSSDPRSASAR